MKIIFTGLIGLIALLSYIGHVNSQTLTAYIITPNVGVPSQKHIEKPITNARESIVLETGMTGKVDLQADLIIVETEGENIKWYIGSEAKPVQDFYVISFENFESTGFMLELYDLTGKKILSEKVPERNDSHKYSLYMSDFSKGVYILNVVSKARNFNKNFKIQKC